MRKRFHYETCCVSAKGEDINEMTSHPKEREVTLATFRRHCSEFADWCKGMGYERGGLTIGHDWAISYHRSFYQGRPCYYAVHSCIEYIWVKET
jgi:hypothetical protein